MLSGSAGRPRPWRVPSQLCGHSTGQQRSKALQGMQASQSSGLEGQFSELFLQGRDFSSGDRTGFIKCLYLNLWKRRGLGDVAGSSRAEGWGSLWSDLCLEPAAWLGRGLRDPFPAIALQSASLVGQGGWSSWPEYGAQPVPRNVGLWAICFGSIAALRSPSLLLGPPSCHSLKHLPTRCPAALPGFYT